MPAKPEDLAAEQFLYLTTTGRVTGLPRQIEIWFVADRGRFYVFSGGGRDSQWVKNIERDSRGRVRVAAEEFPALAKVIDHEGSGTPERVQALAQAKYGWSGGLPVELTPA